MKDYISESGGWVSENPKYIDDYEFEKHFFKKLIKEEPFKSSVAKLSKDQQGTFCFLLWSSIYHQRKFYDVEAGNSIVQRPDIWNDLKKYTDGYGLMDMVRTFEKEMTK